MIQMAWKGLYVPNSQFRETSKDVASGAMSGNMNMSMGSTTGNSLAQWGMQAVNNAYQKTSNAISKAIKKKQSQAEIRNFRVFSERTGKKELK